MAPGEFQRALLWVLSFADGAHDLVAIARRSGLAPGILDRATTELERADLVRKLGEPAEASGRSNA